MLGLLTEAENGGQVSELGVADALRNGEAGDGDAWNDVGFQKPQRVARGPLQHREEVLKTEEDLSRRRLVLELPQWVVREERLLQGVLQRLHKRLRRRNRRPVGALAAARRRRWVYIVGVTHRKEKKRRWVRRERRFVDVGEKRRVRNFACKEWRRKGWLYIKTIQIKKEKTEVGPAPGASVWFCNFFSVLGGSHRYCCLVGTHVPNFSFDSNIYIYMCGLFFIFIFKFSRYYLNFF